MKRKQDIALNLGDARVRSNFSFGKGPATQPGKEFPANFNGGISSIEIQREIENAGAS